MKLMPSDLPRMIDCSLLRNDTTPEEVEEFLDICKRERFVCAFVMPCYVDRALQALASEPDLHVGGPIGFPTGAEPTAVKLFQAARYVEMGVDELDAVINIGLVKSGRYDAVLSELRQLAAVADGRPLKVILETTCLTEQEISAATELVAVSGAAYVKTGTGFMPSPTTLRHIEVMAAAAKGRVKMKAAGGIRNLDMLLACVRLGVSRFGIKWQSALSILAEMQERYPDGVEIPAWRATHE